MRTKTLLIAAAALVAGIISSQAQTVYSANVVGYVNLPIPANQFTLVANPLDNGTNTLNSLFASAPVGAVLEMWNGSGYSSASKTPAGWNPNSTVAPGEGFFIKYASSATNTFVGSVVAPSGTSVTNSFQAGVFYLVSSPIPYADTLTGTNLNLQLGVGSVVEIWNGAGFTSSSRTPAGWSANLTITPGEGFFVKSATATNWVETFNQ
ncbi:MAG: hypothetical protein ACREFE_17105 [Limisphaerales bacterium]